MDNYKLIFHTGYPKTATTYIQKYINKVDKVNYLGCFYQDKELRKKLPINIYHDLLFPSFRREVYGGTKNFTRNNYELIMKYAEFIVERIRNNPDKTHCVISDEKIGDFFNHMGEYNIFLVITLGNKVREILRKEKYISLVLSISIRRQDTFLWSFYNQHACLRKSFSNFLNNKLNSNQSVISGLYYSQCLSTYELLAGKEWNINFVPYEILSVDNNPKKLLNELFFLNNEELNFFINPKEIINNRKSFKKNSNQITLTEKYYLLGEIGYKLFWGTKNNLDIALQENTIFEIIGYKFLNYLGKFFLKIDGMLSKYFPKKESMQKKEEEMNLILDKYREDNNILKLKLQKYDLDRYGY